MIDDYLQKIKRNNNVSHLKAAIYARYSSDMQRSESIDAQIRLITDFAQRHNIVILEQYVDEAKSAKRDNREAFQRMISDSKTSDWQLVIVHKLDRFARNRYDSATYRVALRKNKKYLLSASEQLDDSPESLMLEAVIEAMSEYYSKNLSREVMKGLTENALHGKHCGGVPPLGYELDSSKFYKINEFESMAVKLIFKRFLEGRSYGEIIAELNALGFRTKKNRLFAKNSLYEILRNEKYTGTYVFNKMQSRDEISGSRSRHAYKTEDEIIRVHNVIPEIVSRVDYDAVQKILNSRKRVCNNNAKETYLLTSKVICGECGGHFVGKRNINAYGKKYVSYVCNRKGNANYKCENPSVNREWLEECIFKIVKNQIALFDDEYFENIRIAYSNSIGIDLEKEKKAIKKEIESVVREINRIAEVISVVNVQSLGEKLQYLEQKKLKCENQLLSLNNMPDADVSINEMKCLIKKAEQMLEENEIPKKELINLVVKKIVVNKDDIQIYLNCFNLKEKLSRISCVCGS